MYGRLNIQINTTTINGGGRKFNIIHNRFKSSNYQGRRIGEFSHKWGGKGGNSCPKSIAHRYNIVDWRTRNQSTWHWRDQTCLPAQMGIVHWKFLLKHHTLYDTNIVWYRVPQLRTRTPGACQGTSLILRHNKGTYNRLLNQEPMNMPLKSPGLFTGTDSDRDSTLKISLQTSHVVWFQRSLVAWFQSIALHSVIINQ